MTQVCDFTRSYYVWRIDVDKKAPITASHKPPNPMNHVRTPLECRCQITDRKTGKCTEYVLGAACKTERVNVTEDIWLQPNADFHPVASEDEYLRIKSWDRTDKGVMRFPASLGVQPERQVGRAADAFDFQRIELRTTEARVLQTTQQIVEVTFGDHPLVARTEFQIDGFCDVLIEYPVKTINVNDRDDYYQVDTGPLLVPDLTIAHERMIGNLRLAYVAHNAPDWAEFLLHVPAPIAEGIAVNHYAKAQRVDAKNTMIEVL